MSVNDFHSLLYELVSKDVAGLILSFLTRPSFLNEKNERWPGGKAFRVKQLTGLNKDSLFILDHVDYLWHVTPNEQNLLSMIHSKERIGIIGSIAVSDSAIYFDDFYPSQNRVRVHMRSLKTEERSFVEFGCSVYQVRYFQGGVYITLANTPVIRVYNQQLTQIVRSWGDQEYDYSSSARDIAVRDNEVLVLDSAWRIHMYNHLGFYQYCIQDKKWFLPSHICFFYDCVIVGHDRGLFIHQLPSGYFIEALSDKSPHSFYLTSDEQDLFMVRDDTYDIDQYHAVIEKGNNKRLMILQSQNE